MITTDRHYIRINQDNIIISKGLDPSIVLTKRIKSLINCRDMWDWLADNPDCSKVGYFIQLGVKTYPVNHCYLCHYSFEIEGTFSSVHNTCRHCPLRGYWSDPGEDCLCDGKDTEWHRYRYTTSSKERAYYARAIANLAREALVDLGLDPEIKEYGDK